MDDTNDGGGLTRRQRFGLIALGFVLVLFLPVIVSAISGMFHVGDGVHFNASDGPEVQVGEHIKMDATHPFPDDRTLNISPHGSISSDGPTEVSISGIGDTYTSLETIDTQGTTLEVDFDDKSTVELSGDVTAFEFRDIKIDGDGDDFRYQASSEWTVVVHDLEPDKHVKALNGDSGDLLALNTTDDAGVLTLDMPNSETSVELQSAEVPEFSGEDPEEGAVIDRNNTELSVDVEDPDGTNMTVTIDFDGNEILNETVEGSGTVSENVDNLDAGDHSWTVEAEDEWGQTTTETYTFEYDPYEPVLENLEPTGDLDETPDELSVDVSDRDFVLDGDEVEVNFSLNGDQIDSQNITANQTVTTSIPETGKTGGAHEWSVAATDQYGQTTEESASYRVPDTLYVRNESNASQLVDDPVDATVRFFGEEQTYERQTSDGTIDMTGLPVDQEFIVDVSASENYSDRTIHIKSIFDQQDVYLLPDDEDSVEVRFTLNDQTGQFPSTSNLYISKPINKSGTVEFEVVHADEFGVEGVTAILEEGERYRLRIESPGGTTQDMGAYRADVSETVELRPDGAAIQIDPGDDGWGAEAHLDNRTLFLEYTDEDELTDSVTVEIVERGNESNQLIGNETYHNVGDLSIQHELTENESAKEWTVKFHIDRDGEEWTSIRHVTERGDLVPGDLSGQWQHIIGIGLLLLSGGAFSLLNRGVGAIMVGVIGAILWWTGWLAGATIGAAVVIYLFVAVMYNIYLRQP